MIVMFAVGLVLIVWAALWTVGLLVRGLLALMFLPYWIGRRR